MSVNAMKSAKGYRTWCITPGCESTSSKHPNKLFFYVPYNKKQRTLWLAAVRRDPSEFSKVSTIYVCEDHFNLEQDMENYIKFKLMGGQKKLKTDVVPHIFACQEDRKRSAPATPRETSVKRSRQHLVNEILSSTAEAEICRTTVEHPQADLTNADTSSTSPSTSGESKFANKTVQTISPPRVHYRSKTVQCNIQCGRSVACSPIKMNVDRATSPIALQRLLSSSDSNTEFDSSFSEYSNKDSDFIPDSEYSTDDSDSNENPMKKIKRLSLERIMQLIPLQSRLYLGIPQHSFFIINLLVKYTPVPVVNIFLTLKKIRTAHTFAELADDFGMSESNASRIFSQTITLLSANLSKIIMWPSKEKTKQLLPIAFMAYYSNVQSIIDCMEIEIEKPNNAIHQSLTWSEYKNANTLKYLISATPNGIITFISTGFGGRASDALIVEHSGFLQKIPPGSAVMADRGFKHIEPLLKQQQCSLIRPPTVEKYKQSTKEEVLETKRVASLRIHIERVIRRLREFKILKPHSCLNSNLLQYTDHIIVIACALANLQNNLIK